VTRYLRAQHCDLFFADAAILVEGPAEKMLVPNFVREHYPYLTQCYITLLEINGSHAHRLRPLIEALGLLTLVITDLDACETKVVNTKAGKTVKKNVAIPPKRHSGQTTNNTSLKEWVPEIQDVDGLLSAKSDDKVRIGDQLFAVRVAYQLPVNIDKAGGNGVEEALPSTFEDALVFENLEFFATLQGSGLASKFREAIEEQKGAEAISQTMFDALRDGNKAEFSLDVIWSKNFKDIKCPKYIAEGLEWLEEHLRAKRVEVLPLSSKDTGVTA
jgi:predicted ATP-dependent endonuclease of OLD family